MHQDVCRTFASDRVISVQTMVFSDQEKLDYNKNLLVKHYPSIHK